MSPPFILTARSWEVNFKSLSQTLQVLQRRKLNPTTRPSLRKRPLPIPYIPPRHPTIAICLSSPFPIHQSLATPSTVVAPLKSTSSNMQPGYAHPWTAPCICVQSACLFPRFHEHPHLPLEGGMSTHLPLQPNSFPTEGGTSTHLPLELQRPIAVRPRQAAACHANPCRTMIPQSSATT